MAKSPIDDPLVIFVRKYLTTIFKHFDQGHLMAAIDKDGMPTTEGFWAYPNKTFVRITWNIF